MLHQKLSFFLVPLITTLSLQANDPFLNDPFGDDIFKEMMQMQKEMDKMFNKMQQRIQERTSKLISPLGTYKIADQQHFVDKGEYYEYITNIPENKENQIDINTKDGIMNITAKIIQKQENKTNNTYSSTSSMRMYQQSIPLPHDADAGSMKVAYKNGKLVITIEKNKTNSTSKIQTKETIEDTNKSKDKDNNNSKITINSDLPSMS